MNRIRWALVASVPFVPSKMEQIVVVETPGLHFRLPDSFELRYKFKKLEGLYIYIHIHIYT